MKSSCRSCKKQATATSPSSRSRASASEAPPFRPRAWAISRGVIAQARGRNGGASDAEARERLDGDVAVACFLQERHDDFIVGLDGRIVEINVKRIGIADVQGELI